MKGIAWHQAPSSPLLWVLAPVIGILLGLVAVVSLPLAAGLLVTLLLLYGFARSGTISELMVGAYWFGFCVYETIFASVVVPGFFYPFYALFVAFLVYGLATGRARVNDHLITAYVIFAIIVMASFVGFANAIGYEVVQRVLAYCFGILIMLQFASAKGLYAVLSAAILTGTTVAGWVVVSSAQGDFAAYRGAVDVNPNDATVIIALGLVPALASVLSRSAPRLRDRLVSVGLLLAIGVMAYAVVLLASRGMTIAVVLAFAAIAARLVSRNPRVLLPLVLVICASGLVLLLPGGTSILERFDEENIESANDRSQLWEETLQAYMDGNPVNFILGFGYDSNKELLQREFGWTTSTHNAFIQILYEFGVLGLAAFLWLHGALLLIAWRMRSELGVVMLGILVFLLGSNLSADTPNSFLYWTALGFVLAIATWGRQGGMSSTTSTPPRMPAGQRGAL